ncbi:MAG TPA: hypothetical protein PLO33_05975 [Kouleothrix sp.]|uniref:hypothetical protein n=1 Tax=Kouleothrix sp. TaxID=2779161 RepID=UPI002BE3967E|nr:hypothetical protein [Kouleothrix sp.]HRC75206.1 hypothetical protein [Kouleothrix sp.]
MNLQFILPTLADEEIEAPCSCPMPNCRSKLLRLHQRVYKPVRDRSDRQVLAYRYRCLACGHTFRVYPHGISQAHISRRVRDLAILLYFLGLSYKTVAEVMDALKLYISKTRVYEAVRAEQSIAHSTRMHILSNLRAPSILHRWPIVDCQNRPTTLELSQNTADQLILTMHCATLDDALNCRELITPLANQLGIRLHVAEILERNIGAA